MTMVSTYKSTYDNQTYTGSFTSTDTQYFAKGVGPVKFTSTSVDETNGEKYEYSETSETVYYSSPGGASGGDPNAGN